MRPRLCTRTQKCVQGFARMHKYGQGFAQGRKNASKALQGRKMRPTGLEPPYIYLLPFLFKTLKAFNFGDGFISWIKLLYTDISSCVGNNGYYSKFLKLTRSI